MATRTRKPLPDQLPASESRRFWDTAYAAAEKVVLLKMMRRGARFTPEGFAHMSAQLADAGLNERRRRFPRT